MSTRTLQRRLRDWGFSFASRVDVDELILGRVPTTLIVIATTGTGPDGKNQLRADGTARSLKSIPNESVQAVFPNGAQVYGSPDFINALIMDGLNGTGRGQGRVAAAGDGQATAARPAPCAAGCAGACAARFRSTQYAHTTNSHWSCPAHAMAVTLGGGGPKTFATWTSTSVAASPQKPYVPARFFARVARR